MTNACLFTVVMRNVYRRSGMPAATFVRRRPQPPRTHLRGGRRPPKAAESPKRGGRVEIGDGRSLRRRAPPPPRPELDPLFGTVPGSSAPPFVVYFRTDRVAVSSGTCEAEDGLTWPAGALPFVGAQLVKWNDRNRNGTVRGVPLALSRCSSAVTRPSVGYYTPNLTTNEDIETLDFVLTALLDYVRPIGDFIDNNTNVNCDLTQSCFSDAAVIFVFFFSLYFTPPLLSLPLH